MPSNSPEKPAENNAPNSFLHIDGVGEYKWAWVKAANRAKKTLAEWAVDELNAAAARNRPELPESSGPKS